MAVVNAQKSGTAVTVAEAADRLSGLRSALVLCHLNPDADTIGSGLALGLALERQGTAVAVASDDLLELPESMADLPGSHLFLAAGQDPHEAPELVIAVDAASAARLGAREPQFAAAPSTLVIDHHGSNTRYGDLNLVVPEAESTTAVLATVFDAWGVELDLAIATCLYAGLLTDTGSFRWVRPGTHLLAERLLDYGIDAGALSRRLVDSHPFAWLPMVSLVLASAELEPNAAGGTGVVSAVVTTEDAAGVRTEEVESIIDIVRTTGEAEVAAVFKQTPTGEWNVSLRAKERVDVSAVAIALGGGGHRFAAGYSTTGSPAEIRAELLAALG